MGVPVSSYRCACSPVVKMIPPRGCAYIVMTHRQDAFRALQKLSRGSYKVNQKAIKVSERRRRFPPPVHTAAERKRPDLASPPRLRGL